MNGGKHHENKRTDKTGALRLLRRCVGAAGLRQWDGGGRGPVRRGFHRCAGGCLQGNGAQYEPGLRRSRRPNGAVPGLCPGGDADRRGFRPAGGGLGPSGGILRPAGCPGKEGPQRDHLSGGAASAAGRRAGGAGFRRHAHVSERIRQCDRRTGRIQLCLCAVGGGPQPGGAVRQAWVYWCLRQSSAGTRKNCGPGLHGFR